MLSANGSTWLQGKAVSIRKGHAPSNRHGDILDCSHTLVQHLYSFTVLEPRESVVWKRFDAKAVSVEVSGCLLKCMDGQERRLTQYWILWQHHGRT